MTCWSLLQTFKGNDFREQRLIKAHISEVSSQGQPAPWLLGSVEQNTMVQAMEQQRCSPHHSQGAERGTGRDWGKVCPSRSPPRDTLPPVSPHLPVTPCLHPCRSEPRAELSVSSHSSMGEPPGRTRSLFSFGTSGRNPDGSLPTVLVIVLWL